MDISYEFKFMPFKIKIDKDFINCFINCSVYQNILTEFNNVLDEFNNVINILLN